MASSASALSVGIDLGTSNSCMAFLNAGAPQVIPNAEGAAITPSIVALTAQREWLVGQDAKHQAQLNPRGTVFSIKRFIGRRYTEPEVQRDMQLVPYELARGESDTIRVHLGGELRSPEEISAMVLRKLREDAEKRLGEKITQAVVTVPAYFNDGQRQATKDAGRIAGFEVLRIINEPTAAALAYGLDTTQEKQKIVVYDLGGGTFDVTVLEILNGLYRVVATSGDTHLGGDDFDQALMEKVLEKFQGDTGVDLKQNPAALQRLREACEQAKCELSEKEKTAIELPFIAESPSGEPLNLSFPVTRAEFESWTSSLVERTLEPCKAALKDSGLTPSEIHEILLVGGMTRMPKVREVVRRFFNREPNTSVNPDEAVALGAAIQSGIILGNIRKALLLDVTPLSLGVETMGGAFSVIIPRNTTIPTKMSKLYTTVKDGQTSVNIKVLQGESKVANQNRMLGFFTLEGLPADVAGNVKVEVTFSIDPNGIVQVSAKNLETGKAQQIKVSATSGLSKEELEKVVKKVEGHKITRKPIPAPSPPEKKAPAPSAKTASPDKQEPSPAAAPVPTQPGEGDFLTAEMIDSLLGGSED